MMEFVAEYGLFILKVITLVVAVLALAGGLASIGRKPRKGLEILHLNQEWENMRRRMLRFTGQKYKKPKKSRTRLPSLYILDFAGDLKASHVEQLREAISAVLAVATTDDKVMVRIESPGGLVAGYGLAAAQLQRIRDRKIHLAACIDRVAASGGYLMAVVANEIIAAPFAIVGSIGVVAQIPNFHRWLKKNNIDVELMTAGEYKRTLTMFGENTEAGRKKFRAQLEDIHKNFRNYLLQNRKKINIDEVATGDHWLATDARELKLVDHLQTSDEYIIAHLDTHNCYKVCLPVQQSLAERLLKPVTQLLTRTISC